MSDFSIDVMKRNHECVYVTEWNFSMQKFLVRCRICMEIDEHRTAQRNYIESKRDRITREIPDYYFNQDIRV